MNARIIRFSLMWCLLLTAAMGISLAQTAEIIGLITDSSGAVIPDASVRVTNENTGIQHDTESNEVGNYTVPLLKPGTYQVSVQTEGFRPMSRTGIKLEVDQVARIDFELEVGRVSESIEVTQTAPLLQTAAGSLGQVVENQQILDLPLNNRTAMGLLGLSPGVNMAPNYSPDSYSRANQFSASGSRPGQNEFLLDGVPNTTPGVWPGRGILGLPVPVDSIREFKVQTNSFSAEYGRSGGGLINTVSKSGSNDLHGSLFWFLRNSKMDANNFFSNRKGVPLTSFKRNQFGGTLGGPIVADRTFFFFNYQGTRARVPATLNGTVPTKEMRNGDFSAVTSKGKPITIYDPLTTTDVDGQPIRQPFAGNAIPGDRINEVGGNLANMYPLPNQSGFIQNYFQAVPRKTDDDLIGIRVDHSIATNHQIFGRFYYTRVDPLSPDWYGNAASPGNAGNLQDVYSATGNYVYTVRPTLFLNFRYGYTQRTHNQLARSMGFDLTSLGFPSSVQSQNEATVYPFLNVSGYGNQGWSNGINAFDYIVHSFQGSATKVKGAHTLKFGADVRYHAVRQDRGINLSGNYAFSRGFTQGPNANKGGSDKGDSIASMLLGTPSGGAFGVFLQVKGVNDYTGLYIQDDWRVTSKLTLNLGLRYDLELPRYERLDRLDWFDFNARSPLNDQVTELGELRGGVRFAAVDGNPRRQFDTDWRNFAPRFGFAYQLRPQTVVRGGYGIFYASGSTGAGGWNIASQGYAPSTPFVGSLDGLVPVTTLSDPFPDGFTPAVGNTQGLFTSVGQSISRVFDRNALMPYNQQWNFSIQNQFGGTMLEVAYLGSRGIHLGDGMGFAMNQLPKETLSLGTELQKLVPNPFYGVITNPGALSKAKVTQGQLLRPYPHFNTLTVFNPTWGASTYHGFTLKVERRFASGLGFLASYTLSKNISDAPPTVGGMARHQDAYNKRLDRSLTEDDRTHRFVASASYELPFGKGKQIGGGWNGLLDGILGGWQMNGIVTMQSGVPLAIRNIPNTSKALGGTQRPNSMGFSAKKSGRIQDRLDELLDPSAFAAPDPFTYGNLSRTLPDVRGPRYSNVDFSLFKNFQIRERLRVQFRGEFFNAFNSPMFRDPDTAFGRSTFGRITGQVNSPRQIQLALKLYF